MSGATGSVKGVTYSGVTLKNITKYGIVIEQDYENGSPTGTPTSGVPITGLTVKGVTGTVASGAQEVGGCKVCTRMLADLMVPQIYILCAKGACSNWTWSGNSITGGKKSTKCENVPSPASC